MHRQMGQPSLVDALLPGTLGRNERLERIGQWYTLSDTLMEEALDDRISFRRFVGLGLEDDTPDYSTISRFRTELANRGLAETLFHLMAYNLRKYVRLTHHAT